jgi:hypothetical protein
MTTTDLADARVAQLRAMVTNAMRLADELALPEVAVRLEQARILLANQPG